MMKKVDVIIPVYKPSPKFLVLLDRLKEQTLPANRIILINTEKSYFDQFAAETGFWEKYENVLVKHVTKAEFDHGRTRNYGVSLSESPYFVMMTDDAYPADRHLLKELLAPFDDPKVGMSYARQLPNEKCRIIEQYTRSFNYPDQPCCKSAADLKKMGIKAFFASDVCAAYKREIFEELKGFTDHTIFNEDMIYARGLLDAGYMIAYTPGARVIHSHNYSGIRQFRRNFDLGVSHALHPEVFDGLPAESEGIRLVKKTCRYLLTEKKPWLILQLIWQSGCKYLGFFWGKRYRHLPESLVRAFSMNKEYWKKPM